jgi:plastocyanin
MQFIAASVLALAAAASAVNTIQVQVGATGAAKPLVYTPEDITAEVGDIIEFSFNPKVSSAIIFPHVVFF